MRRICVVGAGYVGLVTTACFAHLGHEVYCVDIDKEKITNIRGGNIPFYEKGLEQKIVAGQNKGVLHFTTDIEESLRFLDETNEKRIVFICVGTPTRSDGRVDLSAYYSVIDSICNKAMQRGRPDIIVVNKSTVPVGTIFATRKYVLENFGVGVEARIDFVSNPEFLREGTAVEDFLHPDRIIIGTEGNAKLETCIHDLYNDIKAPIYFTGTKEAEMIKYMSNAFLATKVSFANEMADICEELGVDVERVRAGVIADKRIANSFLHSGLGWGGSCFPKDVKALRYMVDTKTPLLNATVDVNEQRTFIVIRRIKDALIKQGARLYQKRVCVLGRSFKPNTDDVRESPAIRLIKALVVFGAEVKSYDPKAPPFVWCNVINCESMQEALKGADVMVLATEWDEFRNIDFDMVKYLMRGNLVYDGRCAYKKYVVEAHGLKFIGNGRG